jgi:hypothetical protein
MSVWRAALVVGTGIACALASPLKPSAFAASATGHVSVTILPALAVTENAPIDFGIIGAPKVPGQIVLSPVGTTSGPPGYAVTGSPAAGRLTIIGPPNAAVSIVFSSGDALTGPGPAMPIGSFTHNAGATPMLNGAGLLNLSIGATLTVGASQTPGTYAGTYRVMANY